ncbi:desulfoferrodoxin [Patescibacteria group bacterium]|nr:desulfoferrodoxin [Patescibacteria group bacterium]
MIEQIAGEPASTAKRGEPAEKHIPVLEKVDDKQVLVKVGATAHPMLEEHWIQWIELYKDGQLTEHKDLNPGDQAQAIFEVEFNSLDQLMAKERCNIHGTWQSDKGKVEEQ